MKILYEGPDDSLVMSNTGEDREEGLHLSDITKLMNYEKDRKLNPNSPLDLMTFERGYTWESILEQALTARQKRPGHRPEQIQEDGIWMSPDWLVPDGDIQLEEWKATKKTARKGFEEVGWHWLPNTMAYLRALMRRGLVRRPIVRWRIWFINGDYTFESDFHLLNDYRRVDVEFDKRELEENWRAIVSFARRKGLLPEETEWRSQTPTRARRLLSKEPPRSVATRPARTSLRTRMS